jgi:hypothetical protein
VGFNGLAPLATVCWSDGASQNIKFQAPNYKQISNFHPVESSGGGPPRGGIPQGRYSMTKTKNGFGISNFGHCDLFDICDL